MLAGTAPGQRATEPPPEDGGRHHIGYGWMVRDIDAYELLWHNGGTGGFRTWFGLLQADGRGVAVLSNTTRSVDALGQRLLLDDLTPDEHADPLPTESLQWTDIALALLIVFGTALPLLQTVRHLWRDGADRHTLVRGIANAMAALALTRAFVAWERVPVVLWNLGAGFTLTCLLGALLVWSRTAASQGSHPVRRRLTTALLVTWNLSLLALALCIGPENWTVGYAGWRECGPAGCPDPQTLQRSL